MSDCPTFSAAFLRAGRPVSDCPTTSSDFLSVPGSQPLNYRQNYRLKHCLSAADRLRKPPLKEKTTGFRHTKLFLYSKSFNLSDTVRLCPTASQTLKYHNFYIFTQYIVYLYINISIYCIIITYVRLSD